MTVFYQEMVINITLTKSAFFILAANLIACTQQVATPVAIQIPVPVADCVFQNQQAAPGWVCNETIPGLGIQAVGTAEKSVAGLNYMKDMAKTDALGHLSEKFRVKVAKMVKKYLLTTGMGTAETASAAASSTVKTITKKTFEVAKIYRTLIGPEGRIYVLVGMGEHTNYVLVEKAVKTSMKNEKALWQEFDAQESFDAMVAGIAAMED